MELLALAVGATWRVTQQMEDLFLLLLLKLCLSSRQISTFLIRFLKNVDRSTEKERRREKSLFTGSLPKWMQGPELS